MTKPAVTMPDPEREVIAILTAAFGAGIVSTDYPSAPLAAGQYRLQVDLEGGDASDYPITERAQVRVVAHRPSGQRTAVKDDADDARAALYTFTGSSKVAAVHPGGRSGVSTDPDTGNVMCWILARVTLKPTALP